MQELEKLFSDIRACEICTAHLPHGPRPVLQAHRDAPILIAGQAPGRRVHLSGVPFQDPSGDRLRQWMGVSDEVFYDPRKIAILPMGFCFPGSTSSGDNPPRPECAPEWRERVLALGRYAQSYHLGSPKRGVTEAVAAWREYWPDQLALPHPSPRNLGWFKKNAWFEEDILPELRRRVAELVT